MSQADLSQARKIVRVADKWDKLKSCKKSKYEYIAAAIDDKSDRSFDAWASLLKRSRVIVADADKEAAEHKKQQAAKRCKQTQQLVDAGLDEEEFTEDVGSWVARVVAWLPLLHACVSKVPNLCSAMNRADTAAVVLQGLGFGDSFINMLTVRALQPLGIANGIVAQLGTGTFSTARRLAAQPTLQGQAMVPLMITLFFALEPIMKWYTGVTLGPTWCILVTFPMFQSLLCEERKRQDHWDSNNPRFSRRAGAEERSDTSLDYLRFFAHAMGIDLEGEPSKVTAPPPLLLPEWADVTAVGEILDLFVALMLRFSRDVLGRRALCYRPGAQALFANPRFQTLRLCQFSYAVDRGSLVLFKEGIANTLRRLGLIHDRVFMHSGWMHLFNHHRITPEHWSYLLPRVALGITLLSEGGSHIRAGDIHDFHPRTLLVAAHRASPLVYPYGRALNGVGKISSWLTGDWANEGIVRLDKN